jgi:hypothetical protein
MPPAVPPSAPTDPLLTKIFKGADKRWYRLCPACYHLQPYKRRAGALAAAEARTLCKPCTNRTTENTHHGYYRNIRISWYNRIRYNAESRKRLWSITMDDLANRMEQQQGRCALTGWSIYFPEIRDAGEGQASVDRIDSAGDYTLDNIQLLDARINMMKQSYSQDFFIHACRAIAAHAEI